MKHCRDLTNILRWMYGHRMVSIHLTVLLWECIYWAMDVNPYIFDEMALVPPQRLRLESLWLQLRQIHRQHKSIVAAVLLLEELARQERRRRTVWVKPWLLRRTSLGHYDTLMQELMRETATLRWFSYSNLTVALLRHCGYHTVASPCAFETIWLTYGSLVVAVRLPCDLSTISI